MELILSKKALKFLKKLPVKEQNRIREKLFLLISLLERSGIIPFEELDIKSLEGEWQGFLRMRLGKTRIIFYVDDEEDILQVYNIGFRGNIYKSTDIVNGINLRLV